MNMVFADADTWMGIYVDGKLEYEGHSIYPEDAVKLAIEKGVTSVERKCVDLGWLDESGLGALPENLSEVVWFSE